MLIELGTADLADCRFAISPLIETHSALHLITRQIPAGVLAPWAERARPRLGELRRAEPAVGALTELFRREDNADFLYPPPVGPRGSFADEIARVRATPLARARAELDRNLTGHRTPPEYARRILAAPDVVDRLADALQAAWTVLVEPEWPRLRAVLERDIVQRAGRLAAYGWAAALTDLHPRVTWADRTIVIRHRDRNTYRVDGRGLLFAPTVFADLALSTEPATLPVTITYRARGVADMLGPPMPPPNDALGPLLGAGRAAVLRALVAPATTSQLVARLGLSLGTVGGHLAVLHAAGLVSRTRSGRAVNYVATPLGLGLLSPDTTPTRKW